jgi:hypothetical protein
MMSRQTDVLSMIFINFDIIFFIHEAGGCQIPRCNRTVPCTIFLPIHAVKMKWKLVALTKVALQEN